MPVEADISISQKTTCADADGPVRPVPPTCRRDKAARLVILLHGRGADGNDLLGQAVEESRGHLGVTEHAGPFAEGQVRRDDQRGLLVEAADQVEQQLPAGLGERQVAEFVEHHEVHPAEILGHPPLPAGAPLCFELDDQLHDVEEPATLPSRISARAIAIAKLAPGRRLARGCILPVPVPPRRADCR
jgi:hypothetical protein